MPRVRGALALVAFAAAFLLGSAIDLPVRSTLYALAAGLLVATPIFFVRHSAREGGERATGKGREAQDAGRRIDELEAQIARLRGSSQELRDSRRAAEAAYEELSRGEARRANSAQLAGMEALVAGVAHELNTPLGAIHSNHDVIHRALVKLQEILADERVTPDELEEVRRIVVAVDGVLQTNGLAVERMVGLVDDLRAFGSPDRAEVDRVDLHEGIDGTLALLGHELEDRITVRREYGALPMVECYPNKLNQVFMNLILNGAQAIQGEGTITITTRAEDGRVSVQVRDTGAGIPKQDLERIFQPGFTTKGKRMGMGLGLLISWQIVEQHGGEISVESVVGEGTAFTVRLPTRLREEPEEPAPPSGAPPKSKGDPS